MPAEPRVPRAGLRRPGSEPAPGPAARRRHVERHHEVHRRGGGARKSGLFPASTPPRSRKISKLRLGTKKSSTSPRASGPAEMQRRSNTTKTDLRTSLRTTRASAGGSGGRGSAAAKPWCEARPADQEVATRALVRGRDSVILPRGRAAMARALNTASPRCAARKDAIAGTRRGASAKSVQHAAASKRCPQASRWVWQERCYQDDGQRCHNAPRRQTSSGGHGLHRDNTAAPAAPELH